MRVSHFFFIFNTIFIYCSCLSNHGSQSHPLSIPQKKTKQTLRENGVGGGKLSSWKLQYDTLSLLVNSFTIRFPMQVFDVKNHWSGSKTLVSVTLWCWPSVGFFLDIVLLSCVIENLQPRVRRTGPTCNPSPSSSTWQMCLMLVLGLVSFRVGQLAGFPISSPLGWALHH